MVTILKIFNKILNSFLFSFNRDAIFDSKTLRLYLDSLAYCL